MSADLDGLEISELLEPALAAVDQRAIVGIAFDKLEFAPDHVVARFAVAVDFDALDIKAFAFLDGVDEIDRALFRGAFAARQSGGEWCAAFGERHREFFSGFVHCVGVIRLTRLHAQV